MLTVQTADVMEAHLNARLPRSRRLEQYKPVSNQVNEGLVPHKPPFSDSQNSYGKNEYEERLFDAEETQLADLRTAELTEDLTLKPMGSRTDRRGSETTVVSHVAKSADTKPQLRKAQGVAETDDQIIKSLGKRKAKKVSMGQCAVEDGVFYDMSFTRVIFATVKKKWFLCLFLNFMVCKSRPTTKHQRYDAEAS